MNQKRILITGKYSRLGFRLEELGLKRNFEICGIDKTTRDGEPSVDITKRIEFFNAVEKFKPHVIIHAAAMTDVELCEKERELAWKVNVLGSRVVSRACLEMDIKLIYISTDYVFNGENGPYKEEEPPSPINYYGITKLEAEKSVHEICPQALTIRTTVPYDWNHFCAPNFLMWLIQKLEGKNKVKLVDDQWSTPTFIPQLAEVILRFCDADFKGIAHVAGKEFINRYDFGIKVCNVFKFDKSLIERTTSDAFKQTARRPLRGGLITEMTEKILNISMLTVEEGLKKVQQIYCKERQGYHSDPF